MSGGAGRRAAKQIIIEATKGTVLVRTDKSISLTVWFNENANCISVNSYFNIIPISQTPPLPQGCIVAYGWKVAVYDKTKNQVDNYYKKHQ